MKNASFSKDILQYCKNNQGENLPDNNGNWLK